MVIYCLSLSYSGYLLLKKNTSSNYHSIQIYHIPKELSAGALSHASARSVDGRFGSICIGTFSNAAFCDGDGEGDRKSNLFPVDSLHFGGKPFSLLADVRTVSFPLSTKREYIFFAFMH